MLRPGLGCSAWRRRCAGAPGPCPRLRPHCRSRAGRRGHSGSEQTARGCLRAQACHSGLSHTAHLSCYSRKGAMKENILEQCPPPAPPSSPFLPVGLLRLLPCCLRLASLRMSMIKVANSRALKRANFCRPCEQKGPDRHEGTLLSAITTAKTPQPGSPGQGRGRGPAQTQGPGSQEEAGAQPPEAAHQVLKRTTSASLPNPSASWAWR